MAWTTPGRGELGLCGKGPEGMSGPCGCGEWVRRSPIRRGGSLEPEWRSADAVGPGAGPRRLLVVGQAVDQGRDGRRHGPSVDAWRCLGCREAQGREGGDGGVADGAISLYENDPGFLRNPGVGRREALWSDAGGCAASGCEKEAGSAGGDTRSENQVEAWETSQSPDGPGMSRNGCAYAPVSRKSMPQFLRVTATAVAGLQEGMSKSRPGLSTPGCKNRSKP